MTLSTRNNENQPSALHLDAIDGNCDSLSLCDLEVNSKRFLRSDPQQRRTPSNLLPLGPYQRPDSQEHFTDNTFGNRYFELIDVRGNHLL